MMSSFFLGIDWFDYWVLGLDYQSIWQSDKDLDLIIHPFDNQAFWDAWWLSWLFRLQNVYSQIKQYRLKPLSKPISQPAPSPPSSYQPPDTVDYLRFLYVSWWWRLLCHHKSATSYWLMPSVCFPGSCPWSFSWEHHAVFQLRRRLALSRLQMQGNHGTVSTS